jgi:hypothetical protein
MIESLSFLDNDNCETPAQPACETMIGEDEPQ